MSVGTIRLAHHQVILNTPRGQTRFVKSPLCWVARDITGHPILNKEPQILKVGLGVKEGKLPPASRCGGDSK